MREIVGQIDIREFGYFGDGINNDAPAFRAALAAMANFGSSKGAALVIPPSTAFLPAGETITIPAPMDGLTILGCGASTIIKIGVNNPAVSQTAFIVEDGSDAFFAGLVFEGPASVGGGVTILAIDKQGTSGAVYLDGVDAINPANAGVQVAAGCRLEIGDCAEVGDDFTTPQGAPITYTALGDALWGGTASHQPRQIKGELDPSAGGGVAAPQGSIYQRYNATGQLWVKVGAPDTSWSQVDSGPIPSMTTLQQAYSNGGAGPQIIAYSAAGLGILLRDTAGEIASPLFAVQDSTGANSYLSVTPDGTTLKASGGSVHLGRSLYVIAPTFNGADYDPGFQFDGAPGTNLTASAEEVDVFLNFERTVQFATGPIAIQRAMYVNKPIYSFVGPSTIGTAATVAIQGAAVVSTNATITNNYALWVQGDLTALDGGMEMAAAAPAVSAASTGRMKYDSGSQTFQVSLNGAPYVSLSTGGGAETLQQAYTAGAGGTAGTITATNAKGDFSWTQGAATSGAPTGFLYTGAAHTTLTASTEVVFVNWNLAQTVQWATGNFATERVVRVQAPTLAAAGASTLTTSATFAISGPPIAGTNMTLARTYPLWLETGGVMLFNTSATSGWATSGATFNDGIYVNHSAQSSVLALNGAGGEVVFFSGSDPSGFNHAGLAMVGTTSDFRMYSNGAVRWSWVANTGAYVSQNASSVIQSGDGSSATYAYGFTSGDGIFHTSGGGLSFGLGGVSTIHVWNNHGNQALTPTVSTSGAPVGFAYTDPANTGMTLSTEVNSVRWDLSTTKQWATGALPTERAYSILAPTLAFVGASTVTNAVTFAVSGPPIAGTNATLTNTYAGRFASGFVLIGNGTDTTAARSNVGAGLIVNNTATGVGVLLRFNGGNEFGLQFSGLTTNPGVGTFGPQSFDFLTNSTAQWTMNGSGLLQANTGGAQLQTIGGFAATPGLLIGTGVGGFYAFSGAIHVSMATNDVWNWSSKGKIQCYPQPSTSGSVPGFSYTDAANTGNTLSTEANSVFWDLSSTKTWNTGAITNQRFFEIAAPTIAFVGASTVTVAATLAVAGAPIAGTNATLTSSYAAWFAGIIRVDSAQALGGGAPATLGTVGGSGPTTLTQNEWIQIDSQNGKRFIPAWA